jgi:phage-related protein (TIGR01555 family)
MKPQRTIRKSGGTGAGTIDGLTNVVARLGAGVPGVGGNNALSQSTYRQSGLSLNPRLLEQMYASSWIVGKVVDCVAEDMTRAGIIIHGTDQVDELQAVLTNTGVWNGLTEGIQWGRLYGGGLAVMMIEGQDLATPLRLDSVTKGSFKGLTVLDRWRVTTEGTTTLANGGAAGLPEVYRLSATNERVHHSRVLRFIGNKLPYWEALKLQGWGASVVERMDDRIIAFDSVTMGTANLVFRAYLRTVRVDRLREVLAAGGKAEENLIKMFKLMQVLQTNEGITLLDKNDEFDTHAYTFSGLSDVILQFGQQLAGASGIPLVRLFGQSPAGLNATGDADIRNYYDNVNSQQEARMRAPVERLLQVAFRSLKGTAAPVELGFMFTPLWQMSEKEKGEIATATTNAVVALEGANIITKGMALREMQRSSLITGLGSTITDEEIDEADEEPPLPTAPEGSPLPGDPDAEVDADTTETPGAIKKAADAWRRYFRRK